MAVASYHYGPHKVGPKAFPAPKRADLRYWYNACRKVIPDLPEWNEMYRDIAYIDVELIHIDLRTCTDVNKRDLYIARKRDLR
jgi:hypothetical protein